MTAVPAQAVRLPRLNLIGAGRVGCSLAALWQQAGVFQVQDVQTRHTASAAAAVAEIGAGRAAPPGQALRPAEVWLIATPDTQINTAAAALALHSPQASEVDTVPQAWHCSGFLPAAALARLQALGWACASAHPALSFANPAAARAQFAGTPCALEGDAAAVVQARLALAAIGGQCFDLASADKPLYHAAAVLSSNFLPVLQAAAAELWRGTGMPEALVAPLWQGFVRNVSANLLNLAEQGPAAALTGPAARGDAAVVAAHAAALSARDPVLGQAYAALSELAGRLAAQGQVLRAGKETLQP